MQLFFVSALLVAGMALLVSGHEDLTAAAAVRVMPFGASIVTYCWRAYLWKQLQDAGIKNFDFVGSGSHTTGPDPCGFPFDSNDEGHPGAKAVDFASQKSLTGWLQANPADVILVHLGTNDVIAKTPTKDIINAYKSILKEARTQNPNIKIVFSNLIPIAPSFTGQFATDGIVDLNKAIRSFVTDQNTGRSPVTFVDNFTGFNATKGVDTVEGEHPNDSGNRKMANKFFPVVAQAIRSAGCDPSVDFCTGGGNQDSLSEGLIGAEPITR